jgi:hypothetical protein
MSLLEAVEYTTPDPDRRLALYGRCSAEGWSATGMDQDDPRLLKIVASSAMDLALLERRRVSVLVKRSDEQDLVP